MVILLKDMELKRILDWNEEKSRPIPRKTVLGKDTPTTEPECWTEEPRTIQILCRLTTAERDQLNSIKNEHIWQGLFEDATLLDNVWIERAQPKYRHTERYDAPWLTSIFLVCSGS